MCEIDVLAPGEVVEGRMNYLSGKPHTIFQAISFVRYTATLCKVRKQAAHGSMRQAECSSCADLSRVTLTVSWQILQFVCPAVACDGAAMKQNTASLLCGYFFLS